MIMLDTKVPCELRRASGLPRSPPRYRAYSGRTFATAFRWLFAVRPVLVRPRWQPGTRATMRVAVLSWLPPDIQQAPVSERALPATNHTSFWRTA